MNTSTPIFKIVVLGQGRVGKTSMTLKFTKNQFNDDQQSSINACYLQKIINITDQNQKVKLAIWDTAGQEKYNAVAPVYYRDAVGAIIVYDITSTQSFEKVKKWVQELRNHANKKNIKIVIVGNKSDLQNQRRVKQAEAQNYAKMHKTKHYTVSAKNGANIAELFNQLGSQIYSMNKKGDQVTISGKRIPRLMVDDPKNSDQKKKKKKQCCQN